jgi:hypothetical protein
VLTDHHVPKSSDLARALAGGQARRVLQSVPSAARGALDTSLHAAAVSGVQWAYLISGAVGVVAGVAVLVLMRRDRRADGAASAGQPVAAESAPAAG